MSATPIRISPDTVTVTSLVGVTRVKFYRGFQLLGEDTTAPYSLSQVVLLGDIGSWPYVAIAFDAAGNQKMSNVVTVSVTYQLKPFVFSFTATPSSLPVSGGATTLSWNVSGANSVSISPGIGPVAEQGSFPVAVTQSTTYVLTATNAAGTTSATASVPVVPPPIIQSFTVTPATLPIGGGGTTLAWTILGSGTSVSIDFFEPPPAPGENCFASEKAEEGAQDCLRFDQVFANIGEGTMEMRFVIPHDPNSPEHNIFQRVFRSDGAFDERFAGQWEFHPAHQHYHFLGFGLSKLWRSDFFGQRLDAFPICSRRHEFRGQQHHPHPPDEPVRTGRKVSFCMADTTIDSWLLKGDGPRTYNPPDCLFPAFSDANNDYLIQGITPGWADTYDWYLPDQYIEVTGVPNGYYLLETTVDPDNSLLEADETNNCGSVLIRLSHMGTAAQHAELIRTGPRCHE